MVEKEKDRFIIDGVEIKLGETKQVDIPVAQLYDSTDMLLSVKIIRGKKPGPVLLLSAGIHGDEINGVEAIRRMHKMKWLKRIKGTLILVPMVNVFGFNNSSRYLPDGRDLNRHFPGNSKGSLASRLAYTFMQKVVKKATHVIDFHTGARDRFNLPQIRASLSEPMTQELATSFGVPVVIDASIRDGSLREAVRELGVPILLFEGGEASRFDERSINSILRGVKHVMERIGMLSTTKASLIPHSVYIAKNSYWMRASRSGIVTLNKDIGERVQKGEVIAQISDPFNETTYEIKSVHEGIIIGKLLRPLVALGDALVHIATFEDIDELHQTMDNYLDDLSDAPI